MRIRLLAFATAAQALGATESEVEVPDGATVGTLARLLGERHPGLAARSARLAFAVDGELARPERALSEGCEVALLPPVSGG
jgi:molybdopterin synthase sulfur carrier subunit